MKKESRTEKPNPDFPPTCEHKNTSADEIKVLRVKVKGVFVSIQTDCICARCLKAFLEKNSITCPLCKKPILPRQSVSKIAVKEGSEEESYVHLLCSDSPAHYQGYWGLGKLVHFTDKEFQKKSRY